MAIRKKSDMWRELRLKVGVANGRCRVGGTKTTPSGTTPSQQRRRRTTPTRYRKGK